MYPEFGGVGYGARHTGFTEGGRVVAVNITLPEDEPQARKFVEDWERRHPDVEPVQIFDAHRRLDTP